VPEPLLRLVLWSSVADTSVRQGVRAVIANATGEAAARLQTREDPMRRLAVLPLLVSLSLLLTLPGMASAARADRLHDEETVLFCNSLSLSDGGTGFMVLDVSEQFGTFADLAIWAEGTVPFEENPTLIGGDASVTVAADLSSMAASIDLFEFDPTADPPIGDFLGVATVDALLTPLSDPIPFDEEFKEGNRLFRQSGTLQSFLVGGMLELPDGTTADLSGCEAAHVSIDVFSNNPARDPASFVFRNSGLTMSCEWETDLGLVLLFADTFEFGTFSDVAIIGEDSFASGGSEDAVFTTSEFSATYEIFTEEGSPLGTASASATITPTNDHIRLTDSFDDGTFKVLGQVLAVEGTLELDLDGGLTLDMDATSCQALDFKSMDHFVDPRGPKPKPIANDTPETALPLAIGDSDQILTGGNAPEPEAPCLVEDPESGETFEVPMGYTAWWTFDGTGSDVTVSTAGSDFDTVVAVYQLVDEALVQVACVDDVFEPEFSLQAVVTVATESGGVYYIQAGGFAGDTGNLVVSLE
jgi:hypothetical protein